MGATNKLSVQEIKKNLDPGLYGDGGGLYLQVSSQRTKAWVFRFMIAGRARKMGLGDFERVSLKDAREKAREAHKLVQDGIDPIEARAARKAALALERVKSITFKECAERYVAAQEDQWRNEKHRAQWKATLETYAYPVIGKIAVGAVDVGLVIRVLEPIWTTKNETASRLRGRIETVLSWAKVRGYRTGENPAAWRDNLKDALPKVSRVKRIKHHPAMPYKDVPAFVHELRATSGMSARALEWTILTAARTSETIEARWSEIDEESRLWIVPADRMKGGVEHRVPLSDAALNLLKELPREGTFIFPGAKEGRPLSNMAMLETLRGMREGLTVHGFRSSFMDWGHETTGYPKEMMDIALAHKVSDRVEAAYRRGDMIEKRRRLMADWAEYCATVRGEGSNVVAMRAAQ